MSNVRTLLGENISISENAFDRTADAIRKDKGGPGWIKRVSRTVGLMAELYWLWKTECDNVRRL